MVGKLDCPFRPTGLQLHPDSIPGRRTSATHGQTLRPDQKTLRNFSAEAQGTVILAVRSAQKRAERLETGAYIVAWGDGDGRHCFRDSVHVIAALRGRNGKSIGRTLIPNAAPYPARHQDAPRWIERIQCDKQCNFPICSLRVVRCQYGTASERYIRIETLSQNFIPRPWYITHQEPFKHTCTDIFARTSAHCHRHRFNGGIAMALTLLARNEGLFKALTCPL